MQPEGYQAELLVSLAQTRQDLLVAKLHPSVVFSVRDTPVSRLQLVLRLSET